MEKQRRINSGNTIDQRVLIDIRNATEDLTRALKVSGNALALAKEIREVRQIADENARKLDAILEAAPEE